MDRIFLGNTDNMPIYLSKHRWDCDWHWGFGYLGNNNYHYHFEAYLHLKNPYTNKALDTYDIKNVFSETWLLQDSWWKLLDLFKQAYALKECAAVYLHGGHMSSQFGLTDVIHSNDKAAQCNADLELVLNTIWEYIIKIKGER